MMTRYFFRFNHSCKPNTEYFWNTDLEVFDLSSEFFLSSGVGAGCADSEESESR